DRVDQIQRAGDGQRDGENDEGAADVAHYCDHSLGQPRNQADTDGQDQCRNDIGQPRDDGRSEERRVGKECRFWWLPSQERKKKWFRGVMVELYRICLLQSREIGLEW